MKDSTQLKYVKVLVDDGRIIDMLVDGDMLRVETVIKNVMYLTHRILHVYTVLDLNTGKMIIDNRRILGRKVGESHK